LQKDSDSEEAMYTSKSDWRLSNNDNTLTKAEKRKKETSENCGLKDCLQLLERSDLHIADSSEA